MASVFSSPPGPAGMAQIDDTASTAATVGLMINIPKTEYLLFNISYPVQRQVEARTSNRSATSAIWDPSKQTAHRTSEDVGLAWSAFWKLENLWRRVTVMLETKLKFF